MARACLFFAAIASVCIFAPAARGAESAGALPAREDAEFFEAHVRPLFIQHCHKCHGETGQPKGGLRLISREAVLAGGESGPAAVAGEPARSLIITAVKHESLAMPPEGESLKPVEIARLERWIARGLVWPQGDAQTLERARQAATLGQIEQARRRHWSLQPVVNPALPAVKDESWVQTPLDRFVLAGLEKHGLAPSEAADKRTLLRRVTFDLIGLPPTPAEIAAFTADRQSDALARVVDRLLASPHYGERWGRYWLDVARYADTKGYVLFEDSNFPWSYTYRDYVVRSFNEDLPFDRFLVEQIAADLLPLGKNRHALAALGFLTLGSGFMNNQHDVIDDRIDVITRGLLGLTVSCARCHDHKFDPIQTEDYYALYGVLASAVEPTVPPLFEDPPATEAYAAFARELAERERKLNDYVTEKYQALIRGARSRAGEYVLAAQELVDKPATEDFMLLADGNDLNPTMINRYRTYLERSRARHDPVLAAWHALAALSPETFASNARATIERLVAEQTPERPINSMVAGALLSKTPTSLAEAAKVFGELFVAVDAMWLRVREQAQTTNAPRPTGLNDASAEALRQMLDGPEAPANVEQTQLNELALLPDRPAQDVRNKLRKAIEEWRASGPAAPPRAMAVVELPTPVQPRVFRRGNPSDLGREVPRRFLRLLSSGEPQPFTQGSGRLELARAIADRSNPLTARVLVNRVWMWHFGAPLVKTPSDFGSRSEAPAQSELLDYLAWSFMEGGWSLKRLHREILLSASYQQASTDRPQARAIDAENVLHWRANRRRLDFEATRDAILFASGRLDGTLGGPPLKNIVEPAATRRTLYGYLDRLNLPGLLRTFDFPNPDATSPERAVTTVPQQALFFLNSPFVEAAAKSLLGREAIARESDSSAKVASLFEATLGRAPSGEEGVWAARLVEQAESAERGWQMVAQALLVSNEFVFVD